ncbi:MAG: polysaccharide deacetylase family protein [Candidatus Eremiobacteraeota bacterium]|nr:polysaccharide deacetylase family protein [Candidatus Eremiobacteraeota bacterium]
MIRAVLCVLRCVALAIAIIVAASMAQASERIPPLQARLGYPANARLLMIHADDFGMSHSVNRAIAKALENGWVSSASIMVPCPWYPEVVAWARKHPDADLGIHLVLNSEWPGYRWGPVAAVDKVSSLLDPQGYFFNDPSLFTHVRLSEIEIELSTQIDKAQAQGVHISHLDSHMIALTTTRHLFQIYERLGHEYGLPIALVKNGSYRMPEGMEPAPDALALDNVITMDPGISSRDWISWYEKSLTQLKPGIYQLIVHLAYDDEEMRGATRGHPDWGAAWRQRDFDMVQSTQFRKFLRDQRFILVNWKQLTNAYASHVQPKS